MYSHGGIVFSGGLLRWVLAFIRNVSVIEEWERNSLYIFHTTFVVFGCLEVIEGGVFPYGE